MHSIKKLLLSLHSVDSGFFLPSLSTELCMSVDVLASHFPVLPSFKMCLGPHAASLGNKLLQRILREYKRLGESDFDIF